MSEYRVINDAAPLPYGLLSVADIESLNNGHWGQGIQIDSLNCTGLPTRVAGFCDAQAGTDEVQTTTITGTPTGGTFTLTFMGETTAAIAYNATAATVQAALLALSNLNSGDVVVTGGPGPAVAFVVTFGGNYNSTNVEQMTATGSFTGGTTPAIAVTTTTPGVRTPKTVTADPANFPEFAAFSLYALRECRAISDFDDAQARAVRMLALGEQRGIERALWDYMTDAGTTVVNLGATAVAAQLGVAKLEDYMGTNYAGVPTLHVPRDVGSILGTRQTIERHGNKMETVLGSLVSAGGGYEKDGPANASVAANESWIFATGTVTGVRGPATAKGPFFTAANDNSEQVLAERTYVLSPDCLIAAIKVTIA